MSCKWYAEKKEEEDKGRKEKYLWKGEDINKVKNNVKGVPRITIIIFERKTLSNIFLFWTSSSKYGIINKIIEEL